MSRLRIELESADLYEAVALWCEHKGYSVHRPSVTITVEERDASDPLSGRSTPSFKASAIVSLKASP